MPNRLIREGLLDSDRYWSVTIESRQLYLHLMLLADDLGLVSLAPAFVRRRCFDDKPDHNKVQRLLSELQDADLLRIYTDSGAVYGFIPRFQQRLRLKRIKHPAPPHALLQGDDDAVAKLSSINGIKDLTQNVPDTRLTRVSKVRPEPEPEPEPEPKATAAPAAADPVSENQNPDPQPTDTLGPGTVSAVMRRNGCPKANPHNPDVMLIAASGVTREVLILACQSANEAQADGYSPRYVLRILERWAADAAKAKQAPDLTLARPPDASPAQRDVWWTDDRGIERKARELGITPGRWPASYAELKAMCFETIRTQQAQAGRGVAA